MTVKAPMPARILNLVSPLPHEGTAMHTAETADQGQARSGAVSMLIGPGLRRGDVDSENRRSTPPTTPGSRTSTMATRTTTTRTTSGPCVSSADSPFSFKDLVVAYIDCRRNKSNTASALAFEAHLERNLCDLHDELQSGQYRPGRSVCFVVTAPKPREVWAADFRDRVVHHLFYNKVAPRFYAGFTADTCACIPGRGTLYGGKRLEAHVRSVTQNWSVPAHYLKLDLSNFFVSIRKAVLREQLARRIAEPWWMALAETILFHDPRTDVDVRSAPALLGLVPEHKRLFNAPADTGLPIGNLSSQFFANVLLDDLDQRVKHVLKCRHYVRYVDDFILLDKSPDRLNDALRDLKAFLPNRLGVQLNPRKTVLQPVARGIDFVGHVIKPWRRTTRPRTTRVALMRIETMPDAELFAAGNSYLGLLGQASHSHADRARVANALLARGHSVRSDLSKIYRRQA
jgi:RNA-directed DNA polymerase